MKKIFTMSIALSLAFPMLADGLRIFKCEEGGIPGQTEPQLMGFAISADGRYVCGAIENAEGFFIGDCSTGEVKWMAEAENGSELRGIDVNGVATGFLDDDGILYSFDSGEVDFMVPPSTYRYVQGEGISNDGSVIVGSFTAKSFNTIAAYSKDGEWKALKDPSDAEIGALKEYINPMTAAKYVSGDGRVILGHLGSFTFPTVWVMNDNGEYETDFFPERFLNGAATEGLVSIGGMYICLSNNGKYVGCMGLLKDAESGELLNVPLVYDTEEKTLKVYRERQLIDAVGLGLYPRAIADDGTFIGTIDQPSQSNGNFGTFIMKAGQEQAELYVDAFPAYNDMFGEADMLGVNIPTGISADGKNLLGYAYYCDDYDISSDAPAYFLTYVLTIGDSGVEEVSAAMPAAVEAVYSPDGRRLSRMERGLNIVRNADGSVSKILKK